MGGGLRPPCSASRGRWDHRRWRRSFPGSCSGSAGRPIHRSVRAGSRRRGGRWRLRLGRCRHLGAPLDLAVEAFEHSGEDEGPEGDQGSREEHCGEVKSAAQATVGHDQTANMNRLRLSGSPIDAANGDNGAPVRHRLHRAGSGRKLKESSANPAQFRGHMHSQMEFFRHSLYSLTGSTGRP